MSIKILYVISESVSIPTIYLFQNIFEEQFVTCTATKMKAELLPYMIFDVLAVDGGSWRRCSGCSRQPGLPTPKYSVLSPC